MIKFSATSFAALTAAFLAASPVAAADVFGGSSTKDAPVSTSVERSWTGLWAGAFGGYTMTNTELSLDHFGRSGGTNLGKADGFGGEGAFGEVQIGFDKQLGRFVVGCFGGLGASNSESTIAVAGEGRLNVEEGTSYLAGCRLGALVNKDSMVYAAGGWRWLDSDISISDEKGKQIHSESVDWEGAFAELGLETRLFANIFGRVAGRYTFLEDHTWSDRVDARSCWNELNADPGKLEIMAGISAKFGGSLPGLD